MVFPQSLIHVRFFLLFKICTGMKWNRKMGANLSLLVMRHPIFVIRTRNIELNYEVESKKWKKVCEVQFSFSFFTFHRKINNDNNRRPSFSSTTQRSAPFYYLKNHFSATFFVKYVFRHETSSLIIKWLQYHFAWNQRICKRKSP